MSLPTTLTILFEDEHIIVCKKPAGTATQTRNTRTPDMESLIKRHLYRSATVKKEPYLAVIHRLDQPVSGILVFAKTPVAAKNLNQQLQNKGFSKHYKAILTTQPPEDLAKIPLVHYMKKDAANNISSICDPSDPLAKKASLSYEIINAPSEHDWDLFAHCKIAEAELDAVSMVHIILDTGRHHQIRVQMSHLGCPIWGDSKYGTVDSAAGNWEQIALCAYGLVFTHPITKKKLTFEL